MIAAAINFILFCCLLFSHYRRSKRIDVPIILLSLYAFIALMGVVFWQDFYMKQDIEIWPFIYLFVVCYIYFIPVIKADGIYKGFSDIRISNGLKFMVGTYIVCAIIKITGTYSSIYDALVNGNWLLMKEEIYNGGTVGPQTGIIGFCANLYATVFMHAILVYAMYSFTRPDISTVKSIFLLIFAILPTIMNCILYVYRGGLMILSLLIITLFFLYRKKMLHKKKIVLLYILSLVAFCFIIMTISISLSRFGDDDAGSSIVDYLGQSMLVFNAGIATRITSYANGQYFFLNFIRMPKEKIWVDSHFGISTTNGSALNTFIGCSYVDFGPILTIIIGIIVSVFLYKRFNKRRIDFADLYLFVFYLDFLYLGVFHCSEGYALKVIMSLLLYLSLKILGKNNSKDYEKNIKNCSMYS